MYWPQVVTSLWCELCSLSLKPGMLKPLVSSPKHKETEAVTLQDKANVAISSCNSVCEVKSPSLPAGIATLLQVCVVLCAGALPPPVAGASLLSRVSIELRCSSSFSFSCWPSTLLLSVLIASRCKSTNSWRGFVPPPVPPSPPPVLPPPLPKALVMRRIADCGSLMVLMVPPKSSRVGEPWVSSWETPRFNTSNG